MKNRLIFIVGLALLVLVIWATTMIGIKLNKRQQNAGNGDFVLSCSCNKTFIKKSSLNEFQTKFLIKN